MNLEESDDHYRKEVCGWLENLWKHKEFEVILVGSQLVDCIGAYTKYCSLVRLNTNSSDYFLKRYSIEHLPGALVETNNYKQYSDYAIIPKIEATFPSSSGENNVLCQAILLPYLEEFKPNSLLEILTSSLNLATIFKKFADNNQIYFDLKKESLFIDKEGGLKLIDFTDLITTDILWQREKGLPVIDCYSRLIPPEGLKYQHNYDKYKKDPSNSDNWDLLINSAKALNPEAYLTFSLAGLIISLSGNNNLADFMDNVGYAFSQETKEDLKQLLENMLKPHIKDRVPIDYVKQTLWRIIKLYMSKSEDLRAQHLLKTLTYDENDSLSCEIYQENLWRK